jgi:hypothetical protein
MREAGCRFLEKLEREEDVWLQVSEKVAREKVSHALRDKSPVSTLTDAKSRLKRRLADPNNKTDDYHFIAANERLLRVALPDSEHKTDEAVEKILTAEIESIGVISASTVSNSFLGEEQRHASWLDHKINGMFSSLNTSYEPARIPCNLVLGDDLFYDDIDDEDTEHETVSGWNNDGDLPQDFNADDCENLMAMLDSSFSFSTLPNYS